MSGPKRIVCVFGTRPDAIKMAPVVKELQKRPDMFETIVTVTGQHREQLDQVLRVFDIRPNHDLGIMQHGQTLAEITSRALLGLDTILAETPTDMLLAQGDTTTTFVGSLAAFYHKVPFGHVEAGLRTDNLFDPFPEELNRRMCGIIADLHFAPTPEAEANLLRENIPANRIFVTGNTGIDALLSMASMDYKLDDPVLQKIIDHPGRVVLVTAHRRENIGQPLTNICGAVRDLADCFTDCLFVYAIHRNPKVREIAGPILEGHPRILLIDPPDYAPFVKLMQRSNLILTDSGGVQEEAPSLGVPVLVLRETTERPEGITAGVAKLVGTDRAVIIDQATRLLTDAGEREKMARAVNPYGIGNAARLICEALEERLHTK